MSYFESRHEQMGEVASYDAEPPITPDGWDPTPRPDVIPTDDRIGPGLVRVPMGHPAVNKLVADQPPTHQS